MLKKFVIWVMSSLLMGSVCFAKQANHQGVIQSIHLEEGFITIGNQNYPLAQKIVITHLDNYPVTRSRLSVNQLIEFSTNDEAAPMNPELSGAMIDRIHILSRLDPSLNQ